MMPDLNSTRSLRLLLLCILFLFVAVHSVWGLDPSQPMSSYIRNRFTNDDGLPSNIVNQMVQSQDGFLWLLVTGSEIVRFDGRHFTMFDRPLSIGAMAVAPG